MNAPKFRQVGFILLSGAALAVGCGGDDGGGGGNDGSTSGTTSSVTTTIGNATNNVNTATSSQSTNSTSNGTTGTSTTGSTTGTGTTGSTTGTGTTGTGTTGSTTGTGTTASTTGTTGTTGSATGTTGSTTGSGGNAGAGCDDPPPTGGNAGGEGGAGGASAGELSEGFNFVADSEVGEWSIMACADDATDCVDDAGANVGFSCGVLQVEITWPESANTAAAKFQIQNVVPESMLHDLSGKTLYARVRMTSASVAGHGYDFNLIAQDFIDDGDSGNDWKWFSTCYNGSGSCPENPSGETFTTDAWVQLVLPMDADLAPDGFAFDGIRKFAIEIATKHWEDGEPFSYDAAPTSFEIDYVAW